MKRYGNVNGFIYRARQNEAPRPDPPDPEPPKPKPKPARQEDAAGESEAEWQARLQANWGDTKRCTGCGKVLPLDCFWSDRHASDGLRRHCKACAYERKKYRSELLKRMKERCNEG